MRDKRAIIIRNPKLQRIRNNLRLLLLKAVSAKLNKSFDEMDKLSLYEDGGPKSVRNMTLDEKSRFRTLQEEQARLRDLSGRSICKCVVCGKADRDTVYNRTYDAWYCTECYGLERSVALERAKIRREGSRTKFCEEKAVEDHSKTFL